MALGAAPTIRTNGMPAVASDANMTTSGATDSIAVTRATGGNGYGCHVHNEIGDKHEEAT
jgi:hypothetical protein